ncbi:MAG TPA: hypothetical protein VGN69_01085 [Solirubrobacteraceae bacterium]|jgi:hypothetical protein|nr:hypothetical protein [Solirubrobacteraceae bacterium]
MGLLDEAIREHLELKRRRGADAAEVARQETEALGPDQRVPEALEVPGPPELEADPAEISDQPSGQSVLDEQVSDEPALDEQMLDLEPPESTVSEAFGHVEAHPGEVLDPGPVPDPAGEEIPGQIRIDEPLAEHAGQGFGESAHGQEPSVPSGVGQPTAEFDVPGHHAAGDLVAPPAPAPPEHPPEGEGAHPAVGADPAEGVPPAEEAPPAEAPHPDDVLEETPEFLQETPEHDRLWFEQRPPKDFDFDK